ncbi:hypothetical protein U9M48_040287 [Paspalum notatum var. saurae]|uniref:Uncharacterized protein n=1 Tax=Paspalum notatum var. saurae TaxID=547442 RepID=A0AAQ3UN30_PASNO
MPAAERGAAAPLRHGCSISGHPPLARLLPSARGCSTSGAAAPLQHQLPLRCGCSPPAATPPPAAASLWRGYSPCGRDFTSAAAPPPAAAAAPPPAAAPLLRRLHLQRVLSLRQLEMARREILLWRAVDLVRRERMRYV